MPRNTARSHPSADSSSVTISPLSSHSPDCPVHSTLQLNLYCIGARCRPRDAPALLGNDLQQHEAANLRAHRIRQFTFRAEPLVVDLEEPSRLDAVHQPAVHDVAKLRVVLPHGHPVGL